MIETARMTLRPWDDLGAEEFHRVTNTPAVMEYLGGVADAQKRAAGLARQKMRQARYGFCLWLAERRDDGAMLGFCGLKVPDEGPILGEVEIGWRFRQDVWGQGYAREGAEACLAWAWANLDCARVIAMAAAANRRSTGLMERLGMTYLPALDFEHPGFHPGRPSVIYAIGRPA